MTIESIWIVSSAFVALLFISSLGNWLDRISAAIVKRSVRRLPREKQELFSHDVSARMAKMPTSQGRFLFALGFLQSRRALVKASPNSISPESVTRGGARLALLNLGGFIGTVVVLLGSLYLSRVTGTDVLRYVTYCILVLIIVGLVCSAGLWAVGAFSNNYTQSINGKKGFLICAAAALLIGAVSAAIGVFSPGIPPYLEGL